MPAALHIAGDPPLRRAIPAKRAADTLGCDLSRVYKLLKDAKIEGYRDGRSVRVFVDSLVAYQARDPVQARPTLDLPEPRRRAKAVPAAHRSALQRLRDRGVM